VRAAIRLPDRLNFTEGAAMWRDDITTLSIGELVSRNPVCVGRETTILGVSKLMRSSQVGELVVADQPKEAVVPIGMVSARDIVTRIIATGLDPRVFTAGDITWSGSTRATVTDSVFDALRILQATRSNAVTVVDRRGCLAGVVTLDDLLKAIGTL
jgi:CBS domain-containing protein